MVKPNHEHCPSCGSNLDYDWNRGIYTCTECEREYSSWDLKDYDTFSKEDTEDE